MNKNWFWFGIAAGFALLLFWRKKACSCHDAISTAGSTLGNYAAPGSTGAGADAGAGSGNGSGSGSGPAGCGCGSKILISDPVRTLAPPASPNRVSIRSPGSATGSGVVSRPGVAVGSSIFAQDNVDLQLRGAAVATPFGIEYLEY